MAASDAAVPPAMGPKGSRTTPPPTAQSKRDRKRQVVMDRLSSMNDKFQRERDLTYRDQLQKIQFDTNLVQRFDPYDAQALSMIGELRKEQTQVQGLPVNAEGARSLIDMAGTNFSDFIGQIEDLIEHRDYQLAQSKGDFDRKVQEYNNVHAYKTETAKREHRALTSTLRDRLVNTLTHKKNRLNKEKEVLEISDSNALLLNPNQFSLTNPSSPGGTHGKRATRLRKDADEVQMYSDGKKRKRNGDDDGSPGPMRRGMDTNNTTPLWQSEKARAAAKQNGPIYSIDKLFTDKELTMHYNSAALAAHQYILRNRVNGNGSGSSPEDSDSNDDDADAESQPSAPMMERQVSHATRSTRGGTHQNMLDDKIIGMEGITTFENAANLDLVRTMDPPRMPPHVPQQYLKPYPRSSDQNVPMALSTEDVNSDIAIMQHFRQYDQMHKPGSHLDAPTGMRKVLEAVSIPYHTGRFVAFATTARQGPDAIRDSLGLPLSSLRDEQPVTGASGGVSMSRQSSQGGVAMSRQGTTGSNRGKGRRN
ncbi:hypothetical protein N3K66_003581 [Trichothecium roseum]|uniref:Uncharacterized protein n=1 Tax=Trichothecium roseum TaxID=47278 RepID=A0ACC0V606_9HYPO|nr:hypothetical protein N3K66_003581 [Trichothecium roseum]